MYIDERLFLHFYRVYMELNTGKKAYLMEDKWYGKNKEKISCKWTTDYSKALCFDTEKQAKEFCNDYFKNFKDYKIEQYTSIM